MADQTNVQIDENTPEAIAYRLLRHIAIVENRPISVTGQTDRKWILDTYAECLRAVRNPESRETVPATEYPRRIGGLSDSEKLVELVSDTTELQQAERKTSKRGFMS